MWSSYIFLSIFNSSVNLSNSTLTKLFSILSKSYLSAYSPRILVSMEDILVMLVSLSLESSLCICIWVTWASDFSFFVDTGSGIVTHVIDCWWYVWVSALLDLITFWGFLHLAKKQYIPQQVRRRNAATTRSTKMIISQLLQMSKCFNISLECIFSVITARDEL